MKKSVKFGLACLTAGALLMVGCLKTETTTATDSTKVDTVKVDSLKKDSVKVDSSKKDTQSVKDLTKKTK